MITGKAKIAGVMGWPVKHSLSPVVHQYWLRKHDIDGAYVPLAVRPERIREALRALPMLGFSGANITVPHKEEALKVVDEACKVAQKIGAVNTVVVREDGSLYGTNTDAEGFLLNLTHHASPARGKAVVLGAGGAARAVCKALLDMNYAEVVLVNRTTARAEMLVAQFRGRLTMEAWEARSDVLYNADLLVNTTTLGMESKEPLLMNLKLLPQDAIVTDIVYTPIMTPLLQQARQRGHRVVDGLGMLLYQAVPGFEAWFGVRPEVDAELRAHVLSARPNLLSVS